MHELAHAYKYAIKGEVAVRNENSEIEAWDQAIEWVRNSSLKPRTIEEIETTAFAAMTQESLREIVERTNSS